jgi:dihydrofolate synthase / folylpolyglutamate synthase
MNYQEALDFIQNHIDYSLTNQENQSAENFNLSRMFDFMDKLGNPQLKYKTIHIAGTKGKGSVAALIATTLQQSGYKVGLYTSPHLQDFKERIQVNRKNINTEKFADIVSFIKPFATNTPGITAYEIQTALAFCYFEHENIDCAVVEVGLGGRLDSTNILTPELSIITSISLDHTAILGKTLPEIAKEKAGIIKEGIPVVIGIQETTSKKAIAEISRERNAPLLDSELLLKITNIVFEQDHQNFDIHLLEENTSFPLSTSMLGTHQLDNIKTAVTALWYLKSIGWHIDISTIQNGISKTNWPGRFEIIQFNPKIIIDGAHNQDSTKRLIESIHFYYPSQPITLIFGASNDKDISGMFLELLPNITHGIGYQSKHPRAANTKTLEKIASNYGIAWESTSKISVALTLAKQNLQANGLILITGSLYTIGEFRSYFNEV